MTFSAGWVLLAAIIIVGFSVDYCVHLANAFQEADAPTPEIKMQLALTTMGISVVAGAATTISSGVFLACCILTFFVKFAFLVCWTILCSFFWALLFFPALVMTFGPVVNACDVSWVCRRIGRCRGGRGEAKTGSSKR